MPPISNDISAPTGPRAALTTGPRAAISNAISAPDSRCWERPGLCSSRNTTTGSPIDFSRAKNCMVKVIFEFDERGVPSCELQMLNMTIIFTVDALQYPRNGCLVNRRSSALQGC
ncbi:uncharacterized protein LOC131220051 [Magnolia sinica]|uniref:uncharacterized protein LOC131220051 n=1 Tax=Magnolia sinica TaxID=86752 RepID=UPI0026592229|nr:uncharacterized protein LOC131220051 [Magnolia sinica]